jgi:hypothetical protein
MSKKKPSVSGESEDKLVKQIKEEMAPAPALPPDSPAAVLAAIDELNEEWVALVEDQSPKRFALADQLNQFIERTNYLAKWCESLGLNSPTSW